MTRQHTAMNHSKSYEALKKIVQEFANNFTTSQADARLAATNGRDVRGQLGRWCDQRRFTTVLDLQRIRSRITGLSQRQGQKQRQGQLRQGQGRIRMGQEQLRREQGPTDALCRPFPINVATVTQNCCSIIKKMSKNLSGSKTAACRIVLMSHDQR